MTLTLNPSTSIRPLGEEHLRMFKRVTGDIEGTDHKIILPKEAAGIPKIHTIQARCKTIEEAQEIAHRNGGRVPTLPEFILTLRSPTAGKLKDRIWFVDMEGQIVWNYFKIDYTNGAIEPLRQEDWEKIPYDQKGTCQRNVRGTGSQCTIGFGYTQYFIAITSTNEPRAMPLAQLAYVIEKE